KPDVDGRETYGAAAAAHRSFGDVDNEPVRGDHLLVRRARARRGGAEDERTDPAAELADRERLRDVVVGAELETDHLVELVVSGREHDDRDAALGPETPADLEPVEPRQHQVEHDEVDLLAREARERLLAVPRL